MTGFGITAALQAISLILLVATLYLGITTHIFQRRTSIRESLEQLNELEVGTGQRVKALLHVFSYSLIPCRSSSIEVMFQFYTTQQNVAGVGDPSTPVLSWLSEDERDNLENELEEEIESIKNVRRNSDGLIVECETSDEVTARRVATEVLKKIKDSRN